MITYKSEIKEYSLVAEPSKILKAKIQSSEDAYNYALQFYQSDIEIYESFFIILMNRNNNTLGYVKISQGGIAGTVADIRIICKYAIECLCSAVIIVHNHPSGNAKPSEADIELTKKIKECLNLFDINFLDSLIITKDEYYSCADNGII